MGFSKSERKLAERRLETIENSFGKMKAMEEEFKVFREVVKSAVTRGELDDVRKRFNHYALESQVKDV